VTSSKPTLRERLYAGLVGAAIGFLAGMVAGAAVSPLEIKGPAIAFYTCAGGGAVAGVIAGKRWKVASCALVGALAGWIVVAAVNGERSAIFFGAVLGAPLGAILGANRGGDLPQEKATTLTLSPALSPSVVHSSAPSTCLWASGESCEATGASLLAPKNMRGQCRLHGALHWPPCSM
jgi:hypothetical protein